MPGARNRVAGAASSAACRWGGRTVLADRGAAARGRKARAKSCAGVFAGAVFTRRGRDLQRRIQQGTCAARDHGRNHRWRSQRPGRGGASPIHPGPSAVSLVHGHRLSARGEGTGNRREGAGSTGTVEQEPSDRSDDPDRFRRAVFAEQFRSFRVPAIPAVFLAAGANWTGLPDAAKPPGRAAVTHRDGEESHYEQSGPTPMQLPKLRHPQYDVACGGHHVRRAPAAASVAWQPVLLGQYVADSARGDWGVAPGFGVRTAGWPHRSANEYSGARGTTIATGRRSPAGVSIGEAIITYGSHPDA